MEVDKNRDGTLKVNKEYYCDNCDFKCCKKTSLKAHVKIHMIRCTIRKLSLNKHFMQKLTDEKPYQCSICEYKCAQKSHLKVHIRCHTGEKPYQCSICEYKCAQESNLKIHMLRRHKYKKPYQCSICEYKCAQKSNLKVHMRRHTGEKPYQCSICKYKCAQKSNLKIHMLRRHKYKKPYQCSICEYKCAQKSNLKVHMRRHTGEKPYQCSICKYKCAQKSNLKIHMLRRHKYEKPYQCFICKFKCIRKATLKRHMFVHIGEKTYQCSICKYKCREKSYLKAHLLALTCEKPYQCLKCRKKSSLKVDLLTCTDEERFEDETVEEPFNDNLSGVGSSTIEENSVKDSLIRYRENNKFVDGGKKESSLVVDQVFCCYNCDFKCSEKATINDHVLIIHMHICTICDYETFFKSSLDSHMLSHTDQNRCEDEAVEEPFDDYLSDIGSSTLEENSVKDLLIRYRENNKSVDGGKKESSLAVDQVFCCYNCDFKCSEKATINDHVLIHMHICTICDYETFFKSSLDFHMLSRTDQIRCEDEAVEEPIDDYLSDIGSSTLEENSVKDLLIRYRENNKSVDGGKKESSLAVDQVFCCYNCDFKCSEKATINDHVLIHMHICTICDYETFFKSSLDFHMLSRTDQIRCEDEAVEEPIDDYLSDIGSFTIEDGELEELFIRYRENNKFENERKKESRLEVFCCFNCDFKCYEKATINAHVLTHIHRCTICDYETFFKSSLNSHMLSHTNEAVEEPLDDYLSDGGSFTIEDGELEKLFIRSRENNKVENQRMKQSSLEVLCCYNSDFKCSEKATINAHVLTHMHRCTICDYETSFKSSLNSHMLSHTDENRCLDEVVEELSVLFADFGPFPIKDHALEELLIPYRGNINSEDGRI